MKSISAYLIAGSILIAQLLVLITVPEKVSAYTPHAPIYISGNQGFNASNGVTGGNGTEVNPFVIEGWDINASARTGIIIQFTTAYFVIRNVYVHSGGTAGDAVYFDGVSNGRVENSTMTTSRYGIQAVRSSNMAIVDCTVTQNALGILTSPSASSAQITITGNDISSNNGIGVLVDSKDALVKGNNVHSNGAQGIFVRMTDRVTVEDNDVYENRIAGVNLWITTNVTIKANRIFGNYWNGIFANISSFITITRNYIYDNNYSGIQLWSPIDNVTVTYNEITRNLGYGVDWDGGTAFIHHNNFNSNAVHARGSGIWDDGCPNGGNYWDNYTGGDTIDCTTGLSGSDGLGDMAFITELGGRDTYPLMSMVNISSNNTPPTVTVTSPNGGEYWTGGSNHTITWTMYDDSDNYLWVWIYYTDNYGANWSPIPGAQNITLQVGNRTFLWTLPLIDTVRALVKVEAVDSGGAMGSDVSNSPFRIDSTPPYIISTSPLAGSVDVPVSTNIQVIFSEPMAQTSGTIIMVPAIAGNVSWPTGYMLTFDPVNDLMPCTTYSVGLSGWKDLSDPGNTLVAAPVPNPFNFTTVCGVNPPSVTVTNPVGSEDWTGNYVKTVSWSVTDPDDPPTNITVDVFYTVNDGLTLYVIAAALPGNVTDYPWLVPLINSSNVKLKVCATDTKNNTGYDYSGAFTIDSASPHVTWTDPADGAIDVALNQTIMVLWNEGMNHSYGNFSLNPPVSGSMYWGPPNNLAVFSPSALLDMCTNYTVTLTLFRDDSDPGNTMASPYSFNFSTFCPGPPSLSLLSPVGGEYWAGGTDQQIRWTVTDDFTPPKNITIYINYTSSVSSGPIAGPIWLVTNYLWTLPVVNAVDVRVNITAIDGDWMQSWDESGDFTIDSTPPSVSGYSPTGWNVPLSEYVYVVFTEGVDSVSGDMAAAFGLRDDTTGRWTTVSWVKTPPTWPQEIRFVPAPSLTACHAYTAFVNGTFRDRASWSITNPLSWTFHTMCAPTAYLVSSPTGKDWSGDSSHSFSWSMSDEFDTQLRFWANYSRNGGADGYPNLILSDYRLTGTVSYTWALPRIDTTTAKLQITVVDSSGLKAVAQSGNFTIDSTPPSILSCRPLNGSGGVTITDDIQIIFTEPIVRSSAETAFSISPNPGSITFGWDKTSYGKDILVVGHKPLDKKTSYRVTFSKSLRDDSDPGNSPASPLWISFTTKPPPPGTPPRALAVGKNQVAVGELVTLDGSGSTGSNLAYVWTIFDNQHDIVEVLTGKVATYTFSNNGRYRVVLTVTDTSTGLSDMDDLEIVVTSGDNASIVILLSSAIIAGALIGGTEVGRVALFMLLAVPMYRRKMKGKDDSLGRGMVLGYIMVHPGDTYTDIKNNLDLNDGTLTWHLSKLEKEDMIKSKIKGTRRHYYPSSMPLPFEDGGELHEIERLLLDTIKGDPGRPVRLLAEELGVSSQLALYHLRKLTQKGHLTLERKGLSLRVYPARNRNS